MHQQTFTDLEYSNRKRITKRNIEEQIFKDITVRLDAAGLMMHGGMIVDATIIAAPPSTKNKKSAVRSKVEYPFLIVKGCFGYKKVAYLGIAKDLHRFHMLFGSANLLMCIRAKRISDFP